MKRERTTKADKSGHSFEIGSGLDEDLPLLIEMYRFFLPKPASQGLPPEDTETCQQWVQNLFKIGKNIFVWRGESIIGHAAVVPDARGGSGEFVIFVHQRERHLGIGTSLARFTLDNFRDLGYDTIWLTVNVSNYIAIRLYRKLGFEFCDMDNTERTMIIKLK
jgi:diamine N-acetyltransferase